MDNTERIRRIVNNYFQYHEKSMATSSDGAAAYPAPNQGASSASGASSNVGQCDDIFTVFATSMNNSHERNSHINNSFVRDNAQRNRDCECNNRVLGTLGQLEAAAGLQVNQHCHHCPRHVYCQPSRKTLLLSSTASASASASSLNGSSTSFAGAACSTSMVKPIYPSSCQQQTKRSRMMKLKGLQHQDEPCHACNGFYGPRYEDPYCSVCHAFLYPNITLSVEVFSHIGQSSDSDSGNDEPVDNNAYPNSRPHSTRYFFFRNAGGELEADPELTPAPTNVPVKVDSLADELQRRSVPSTYGSVSIEILPPEVLMYMFQYLDELALWCFGQVCSRWKEILLMCVKQDQWKQLFKLRWPLYPTAAYDQVSDWYELYTSMMKSLCCIKCVRQMAAQELPPNWEENQWRKHRLRSELRAMRNDPLDGIETEPLDNSYCHWQATIHGPAGSPYEGGLFFLYIQVPASYPLYPPVVRFLTKVFHPNVSRHGDIGIDSIHHNWSLVFTLSKLLISIQSLLTDPYCDVCMEPEIGELYMTDRQAFNEQAQLWTYNYAMHDMRVF